MSAAGYTFACEVCGRAVETTDRDAPVVADGRCPDCRDQNRTTSWRVTWTANGVVCRTEWRSEFDDVRQQFRYLREHAPGTDYTIERRTRIQP